MRFRLLLSAALLMLAACREPPRRPFTELEIYSQFDPSVPKYSPDAGCTN